nr:uncharacterized protein LOC123769546 [Procambarus clarkii]
MPPATPSAAPASRVTHRPSDAPEGQLQLVIEDEGHRGSSHRAVRSSKVRSWGGQKKEEELVLNLNDGEPRTTTHYDRSSRVNSALLNHSQKPIPAIIIDRNVKQAVIDNRSILYDEEVFNDVILEDLRTGAQSHFDSKKAKGLSGKVKDKLFPNRHLPKKKKMNRVQKVEKFVDSIMVEDLENEGRVTPLFIGEADLTHGEFERKRQDILQSRTKNYMEGEVEVLSLDASPPSTSRLSPAQAELLVSDERRKHEQKRREEKRTAMRLEGIEEEPQDRSVSHTQEPPPKTVLSPEEYEDYIGDAVEKDYPELAGGVDAGSSEVFQQQDQTVAQQQPLLEQEHPQQQPRSSEVQHQPTGPLSGSASMNFMDEHSPTSNGNGDFYHRCVAKLPRDPPRHASGSFSVEANYLLTSAAESRAEICRSIPETSLLNNNESINRFASHFRTSCVASINYDHRDPQRTTSASSSTSASANESRNNSASEPSSMSISTGSVCSNLSNINKNRSNLFLPTSTTSLPEISIEPPTPQAPKPNDGFDRESKVKYDLRVPGYRSMFLTVPGFDDDNDRFLPKYSFDCDDEEQSSSDDDVVHKPRAFASLADMDGSRCLKRYGSSCDIAKFGLTDEAIYSHEDDLNANFEVSGRKSKVGGTGSGPFVAKKLAVFEKVAEEEHQKFIEYQEVRKRIFRAPKKSGEYIEKFFSPKVIETIDARACAGSRHEYYDDEYDNYNDDRSPTPPEIITPYGGHSSPQLPSKYSSSSHVYPSTNSNHPGSVSPSQEYTHESYNDEDFDVYDYVCDRQHSPIPASDETVLRYDSPEPHSTNDVDDSYWQSTEYKNISQPRTTSPGASSPPPGSPKDNLDQRTDEVLEMLDHSYSDMAPEQAGPSHDTPSSWRDEVDAGGAVAGENSVPSGTLPLQLCTTLQTCLINPIYDRQGPAPSQVGGQKRKAAPPPPTPPSGAPVTPVSDTKRGGFFGRARREKEKEKKEREREKKDKDKKDKKEKKKDKDVTTGKRFQLFGGTKKTSEPSSSEAALAISPKRDKGRRVFFGRGRENFVGRNPCISHESDPQVARMTGESFEQESIDLEGETEVL